MSKITARYWQMPVSDQSGFPENSDPELTYKAIQNRPNCGIAFSGGGTVSAALAPGFIKALEDTGLMKNVKYISGVSGGTWGTAAYCYALDVNHRTKYFGTQIKSDLSQMKASEIEEPDEDGSMLKAVTDALIGKLTVDNIELGHEAFTRAVGQIFLKPFDLHNTSGYFSCDDNSIENIKSRNKDLKDTVFLKLFTNENNPDENSPFYIMNGTLLTPPRVPEGDSYNAFPFEFTPLYCGTIGNQGQDSSDETIGGYFVEPFGFNTVDPVADTTEKTITVDEASQPLILSSPVGTSGSAIEQVLAQEQNELKDLTLFLPAFNYWNPADDKEGFPLMTQNYLFGDGGISEDTGLASLLARKVKNIVLFITEPFDINAITDKTCEIEQRHYGYNQIARLFGAPIYSKVKDSDPPQYNIESSYDAFQQFFKTEDFESLKTKLATAKADNMPIVVTETYEVQTNTRFGIKNGWKAIITWVVVDTCPAFNEGLAMGGIYDPETGKFKIPGLENFPAICTFEQNGPPPLHPLIQLTPAQANLLANQAYWMIGTNDTGKAAIIKALNPDIKE